MHCPECDAKLSPEVIANSDSGLTMVLEPDEDQLLQAKTLGGVLQNLHDLFSEIGKEQKVQTSVLVNSINSDDEGKISIRFVIARSVINEPNQ